MVAVRTNCNDSNTQLTCSHNNNGNNDVASFTGMSGDKFFVWVDGVNSTNGNYWMAFTQ